MKTRLITTTAILLIAGSSFGQTERTGQPMASSRHGKHDIQINIGLLSSYGVESDVSAGNISNTVGAEGFFGSVAYNYWIRETMAIGVTVGVMGSEVNTSVSGARMSVETSNVVPILFGIKYQPLGIRSSENVKPYVFASVGPCIGSGTQTGAGTTLGTATFTESALGSHFGIGTDIDISRLFVAGVSVGYFLASDFDRPIGGQKNYSSPSFLSLYS